ncbi:hypothetical protein [uncultured Aureimonas sp.]|uniref:TRAFAC clade GTPase domain-containing protein n=1 Tax=uncultured Aureimonas sp. TaxID=1604662 RepID=UPI0025F09549|nr:hypothetical protein [uncultured Aureimonas sp.]
MTEPVPRSISVIGLPGSGKTTYLAALWHLVRAGEVPTRLRFGDLRHGNYRHLNDIAARWRQALEQDRTQIAGMRMVAMDLVSEDGSGVRVTFPDVPGEDYQRMWENREVGFELADALAAGGVALLVNGDRIEAPRWIHDDAELCRLMGIPYVPGEPVPWRPSFAPTQVQLVELLQSVQRAPLARGPRRLAVMVSAWDKAEGERKDPDAFVRTKLPLLHQYLTAGRDPWTWRAYGVSAQGGDYDSSREGSPPCAEAEALRDVDLPSERIRLVTGDLESHDLTETIEWLIG